MESMAEGTIKDLVASGHALADDMTGAPSVLVRCLATQLEVQLVRANALAEDHQRAIESIKQADSAVKLAHEKFSALVAENAGLKHAMAVTLEHVSVTDAGQAGVAAMIINDALHHSETPATDAFLAEIRAEARNEGINYTASRLAAAFNQGFINKSLREVFDVTRMILSAKEELANEPHPIDGLSGEYAEKSLEEWAEQIRKGGSQ
ncbi:TPA: hypothetical protein ODN94_002118 [Escherichia coli]|uniref:hypothetical protein n=1 Tax=Escherichia coli TaxID=562 RepID=UPI001767E476|nr:hypothetical protein [Escherichia coli]EFH7608029.1 hypothetical protein [Escherichia coli]EFH8251265.1 hypothetical protein [Escherichia coli]EFN6111842.1 hypothetical protein [Escherichia coli]EFO4732206.1 hypothetical protein [Escherichia coli]EKJ2739292.1 hypothetical protein [Escherichia coli]